MKIYEVASYQKEIKDFSKSLDLSFYNHKTLFIAGACGLVMSYLIDTLLSNKDLDIKIIALAHSPNSGLRFKEDKRLSFIYGDVKDSELIHNIKDKIDIVINGASLVDPKSYKERPIDTMLINIYGTKNLLDLSVRNNATFLLTSSCEIYGEADVESIDESYCGKLDPMDVRSCYNESKRASETLCVSYSVEHGIKTLIARLSRTFGPTQSYKDTKALSQFLKNGLHHEDIVLKSKGEQLFSYTYVQDVVSGILTILEKGNSANAYNVTNRETLRLKDVAQIVADISNTKVIFDLSDDGMNKAGYSRVTKGILDPSKLESLGWQSQVSIKDGIKNTLEIFKQLYE